MKKSTGRARPKTIRKSRKASDRSARPVPEDFDVGVGPLGPVALADEFDVGEGVVYRPLDTSGIGQQSQPMEVAGAAWRCRYGCPGVRNVVADLEMHTWDCPYWDREGKNETPF